MPHVLREIVTKASVRPDTNRHDAVSCRKLLTTRISLPVNTGWWGMATGIHAWVLTEAMRASGNSPQHLDRLLLRC